MSVERIKTAIANKKLRCPHCGEPILNYEKYVDTADSVWDGAGDTSVEFSGCKVTLVCGNGSCDWKERTEYWQNFADD
jgi:hypothetical protein